VATRAVYTLFENRRKSCASCASCAYCVTCVKDKAPAFRLGVECSEYPQEAWDIPPLTF
jgi:hypothetical protein